jgi:hypothetical protein
VQPRKRLHALYDARNVIALGYVDLPPGGGGTSAPSFSIKHSRRGRFSPSTRARDEATDLVRSILAAQTEIDDFLGSLRRYQAAHPELTAMDVLDRLRGFIEARRAERGESPEPQ